MEDVGDGQPQQLRPPAPGSRAFFTMIVTRHAGDPSRYFGVVLANVAQITRRCVEVNSGVQVVRVR
ncbi:hypothetical protein GCM10018987_33650 [Streptomyces cremeus]